MNQLMPRVVVKGGGNVNTQKGMTENDEEEDDEEKANKSSSSSSK